KAECCPARFRELFLKWRSSFRLAGGGGFTKKEPEIAKKGAEQAGELRFNFPGPMNIVLQINREASIDASPAPEPQPAVFLLVATLACVLTSSASAAAPEAREPARSVNYA